MHIHFLLTKNQCPEDLYTYSGWHTHTNMSDSGCCVCVCVGKCEHAWARFPLPQLPSPPHQCDFSTCRVKVESYLFFAIGWHCFRYWVVFSVHSCDVLHDTDELTCATSCIKPHRDKVGQGVPLPWSRYSWLVGWLVGWLCPALPIQQTPFSNKISTRIISITAPLSWLCMN